jgi:hypothetical protein
MHTQIMSPINHLEIIQLLNEIHRSISDLSSKSDNASELFLQEQCNRAKVMLITIYCD